LKASVLRRIEKLEEQIKPLDPELPPFDYDLLIESESDYFSKQMDLLRTKARELGYGDKNNKLGWFDLRGCDPVSNDEVRTECLESLDDEERQVIETFYKVIEKCIRLTANLSEEEKAVVKKYNRAVTFFGNSSMMNLAKRGGMKGYTKEELAELRVQYEQIMAKHGEKIYE